MTSGARSRVLNKGGTLLGNVILYDFCGECMVIKENDEDVGQPGIRAGDTMAFLIPTSSYRQREKSRCPTQTPNAWGFGVAVEYRL